MNYECEKCGRVYPEKIVTTWGKSSETDGFGSQPKCVELVPSETAPPGPQ